jgi:CBS domain-containing protein
VVDSEGRLVGLISRRDIVKAAFKARTAAMGGSVNSV